MRCSRVSPPMQPSAGSRRLFLRNARRQSPPRRCIARTGLRADRPQTRILSRVARQSDRCDYIRAGALVPQHEDEARSLLTGLPISFVLHGAAYVMPLSRDLDGSQSSRTFSNQEEEFMAELETDMKETLITLTSDIVAAHVSNNSVSVDDVPTLIQSIYGALASLGGNGNSGAPAPEPAVSIRASVKREYVVCLEDGKKMKMLKRHLMTDHGLTPDEYPRALGPAFRLSDGRPGLRREAPRRLPRRSASGASLARARGGARSRR